MMNNYFIRIRPCLSIILLLCMVCLIGLNSCASINQKRSDVNKIQCGVCDGVGNFGPLNGKECPLCKNRGVYTDMYCWYCKSSVNFQALDLCRHCKGTGWCSKSNSNDVFCEICNNHLCTFPGCNNIDCKLNHCSCGCDEIDCTIDDNIVEKEVVIEKKIAETEFVETEKKELIRVAEPTPEKTVVNQKPTSNRSEWKVSQGDSLWKIAARSDVYNNGYRWTEIYDANKDKIKNPNLIYPGQTLIIP